MVEIIVSMISFYYTLKTHKSGVFALVGILLFAIGAWRFPSVFIFIKQYVDIFAVGRSSTKVIGFFTWLALAFVLPLLPLARLKAAAQRFFPAALVATVVLGLLGNGLFFLFITSNHIPISAHLYAVDAEGGLSFSHLTHSHLLKPSVAFLSRFFPDADFGAPWISVLQSHFPISPWLLIALYTACFLMVATIAMVFLFSSSRYPSFARKLLFSIAAFIAVKSIIDGGFLSADNILAIAALSFFAQNYIVTALAGGGLAVNLLYPFTEDLLPRILLIAAFFIALFFFDSAYGIEKRTLRFSVIAVGIALIAAFFIGGNRFRFFSPNSPLESSYELGRMLPAATVYVMPRGNGFLPKAVTLESTTTLGAFLKLHPANYEYFESSVRIKNENCLDNLFLPLPNRFFVVGQKAFDLPSRTVFAPWLLAENHGAYFTFEVASCLPNGFASGMRYLKTLFPEEEVILIYLR